MITIIPVGTKVVATETLIFSDRYVASKTGGEIVKITELNNLPLYHVRWDGFKSTLACFPDEISEK